MTGAPGPIRVLHVDDDPDVLELTASHLDREDPEFAVEVATSAREGLDCLDEDVDCVVTDYDLPERDGIAFLESVRDRYPDLPVVLFTGTGSEDVASEAISAGVTDYLRKGEPEQYAVLANRILNAVDQRRSRQRLRRHREYTDRLLDAIDDLFFVHGEDGTLTRWNEAFSTVTGYSDEEIAGMTGEQFVPESERDRTAEAIAAVFETGHARLEAPLLTKDGTAIPYEYSANRVTGPEGDARLVGVGRDISERKRYERRLEQVQARTRELMHTQTPAETGEVAVAAASDDIDAPYAAVHVVDDSGDVLEPLAHRDAAGEFGEPPAYDPAGDRPATARFVWDVFEDQEAIYVPDTREHDRLAGNTGARSGVGYPLGDHGVLTVTATEPGAFGDADRSLLEILATAVTAALDRVEREKRLRERERELTRQNRRLDEFASVVSHDLRNPLNVASGRLELARERSGNGDLEDVARALDRMDALIEDLLALARRGEAVSEVEAVDLEDCVRDCWQTVETEAAVLTVETDATVRADRSRVQQLLANLVGNAVEHGGEDVTVTVGDLEEGFYVEDDGPGIPADQRDRVFEAGYSGSGAGTGFGLRIVEQVVEDHGWELDLTDGEDGGARFEVRGVERVA